MHYDIVLGAISTFVEAQLPAGFTDSEKRAWSRVLAVIKAVAAQCYAARDAAAAAAERTAEEPAAAS